MAILERLRVKAGVLLAVIIGLALLAFVLSDFLDSGGSLFNRSKYEIAEVSGKSVPYNEYDLKVKELEEIQKLQSGQQSVGEEAMDQIRNATWENMIQDMLLEKQYSKLGIEVSEDELAEIIKGENPHPFLAQLFTNPQTGVLDRISYTNFLQRVANADENSEERKYYLFVENEILRQRKNSKYNSLIRQGLYATSLEAKRQQIENSRTIDVNYIVGGFNTMADSAVKISESDINKYYKENINLFKQKESRDITYAYFEVVPSESDFKAAEQWINEIKPDFEKAEDPEQFVMMESDIPFDKKHYNEGELPDTVDNALFNAAVGTSFGPYFNENSYRISLLVSVKYLPDSVKARHILLRPTQADYSTLRQKADSLANLIKNGAEFALLAMTHSADGSAQAGGDLGWFREGEMVEAFSDSCFFGRKGDVKIVETQYGLHIIEILDQSKPTKQVQIATLAKNVLPSEETDHNYYMKADEFAGKNNTAEKFIKAIESEKIPSQKVSNLGPMDKKVNDIASARSLVSWAYKAEEKEVSGIFKFDNKYVVALLDKIREDGPAPLKDVRADVENKVRQQKNAEKIAEKFLARKASAKTLEDLAKEMNLPVEPISGISFASTSFGNAGVEPKVIAAATSLKKGAISDPIIGENGVYVLSVINESEPTDKDDKASLDLAKNYVERNYAAKTNYLSYQALKELAEIKDNRREFY